jgi:excisionase family DNA binding protein
MTLPDLLTLDEACAHVRLSPWALRRAIARGELRAYKPAGRIRISPDALAAWLESTAPPASPAPSVHVPHKRRSGEADTFRALARRVS